MIFDVVSCFLYESEEFEVVFWNFVGKKGVYKESVVKIDLEC